ncbi:phenylalanine--tRNA ligase beta subunit [Clostridia bacterium]|nr:phenylalanine--tRNA ligase beta subunit [Clostridia bacterium]
MKLPKKWLNDFTPVNVPNREFSEGMSLSGSKVEGVVDERAAISGIVVGRVLKVEPHPNADRLRVCTVDVGEKTVTILTAAPNVEENAHVPVALDGASLPGGKVIRAGEMRGLLSEGMMCSIDELGLTLGDVPYADKDGLLLIDLDDSPCKPGDDIREVMRIDETVYEFEITNNRPDCLSVRGLAREAAATFRQPLTLPGPTVKGGGGNVADRLKITVKNRELCPRYSARVVKDVKIEPSPLWLRSRLRSAGVRPINNIVDITNYVMLEYGQPMHAFDYACLDGGEIVVRAAREGETMKTLDGRERRLDPSMLVIADGGKPVCVAGVMGGENSEISGKTTTIVLESATFDGPSVRKTALNLAMRTDASSRFEKGLDSENTVPALDRACELIERLNAGVVLDGVIDVDSVDHTPRVRKLEPSKINKLLGADISRDDMESYLKSLGFGIGGDVVAIPSFRADVEGMADLAEEVARLYGYNNIGSSLSAGGNAVGALSPRQVARNEVGRVCREYGFDDIFTYSFIAPSDYAKINLENVNSVTIENPLGEDKSVLRVTTIPSLLTALSTNAAARNPSARLFEIAQVFEPTNGKLPNERTKISLGAYGGDFGFFELKGLVEAIGGLLRLTLNFTGAEHPSFHPGRRASVSVNGECAGVLGEIHPQVSERYGMDRVCAAELDFDVLLRNRGAEPKYQPLPRFPAIRRDITMENVPPGRTHAEILGQLNALGGDLLAECYLAGVWNRNLTYRLLFRSPERTLTDAEVDERITKIKERLEV